MKYLKKAKKAIVEYWEIFVAAFILLLGVIIGTSGGREKVSQKDADARKKAAKSIQKGTDRAIEDYHDAREENASVKLEKEQEADKKEKQRKEDLLNNSSKLDKVLKDKYSLDGE
jgi:hypothetical protein